MKEQSVASADQKGIAFLVGCCADNQELVAALSDLEIRIVSEDQLWTVTGTNQSDGIPKIIIIRDFDAESSLFSRVRNCGIRVVSERFVLSNYDGVERKLNLNKLWESKRATHNRAMRQCVICFSGAFESEAIRRLADIVHFQNGSIRKEVASRRSVTHVVAASPSGDKYRQAVSLGIPVMTAEWLTALWALKDEPEISDVQWRSLQDKYRLRPFFALRIVLFGFDDEADCGKRERMRQETLAKGGFVTEGNTDSLASADDQGAFFVTHVVVNEARFAAVAALSNDQRAAMIRSLVAGEENEVDGVPSAERVLFGALLRTIETVRRHNESLLRGVQVKQPAVRSGVWHANWDVAQSSEYTLRVVRSDWFWKSLQIDACVDENVHRFGYSFLSDEQNAHTVDTGLCRTPPLASAAASDAGRRLTRSESRFERLTRLLSRSGSKKDRERERERERDSFSFLDATRDSSSSLGTLRSAESHQVHVHLQRPAALKESEDAELHGRCEKLYELLYTESNYVEMLDIVARRLPGELCNPEQPGGATLSASDARRLFARFEPLHALHLSFKQELEQLLGVQRGDAHKDLSDACVGDCIIRRCAEFERAYSRVINDFEHVRDEVQRLGAENGRFYAFLELLRRRPECGRQDLADLLIRPVQRLPSVALILAKMLDCTPTAHPDHAALKDALDSLQRSLARINENKRTDEKHKQLFSIVNEIKNCPATLLSSQRYVVAKATLVELAVSRRGHLPLVGPAEPLVMLLFNDVIEFCTPRARVRVTSGKSQLRNYESAANLNPNGNSNVIGGNNTLEQSHTTLKRKVSDREQQPKASACYKHVKLLTLASVRSVIDISDSSVSPDSLNTSFAADVQSNSNSLRVRNAAASKRLFGIVYDTERNEQLLGSSSRSHSHASTSSGSEQLVAFALIEADAAGKRELLDTLCRQVVSVHDDLDFRAQSLLTRLDAAYLHVETDLERSKKVGTMSALRRGTRRVSIALSSFRNSRVPSTQANNNSSSNPQTVRVMVTDVPAATVSGYYGPANRTLLHTSESDPVGSSLTLTNLASTWSLATNQLDLPNSKSAPLDTLATPADSNRDVIVADCNCTFNNGVTTDCKSSTICDACDVLFSPSVSSLDNEDCCTWQPTRTPDSASEFSCPAALKTGRKKGLKLFGLPLRMPSMRRQKVEAIREERERSFDA